MSLIYNRIEYVVVKLFTLQSYRMYSTIIFIEAIAETKYIIGSQFNQQIIRNKATRYLLIYIVMFSLQLIFEDIVTRIFNYKNYHSFKVALK